MILYPAIDISEGQAVRLVQGDFAEKTVYRDSPLEAARAWVDAGARFLHVVDLDGARTGTPKSLGHLEQITHELAVPVQYGGGLRSLPAVRDALRAGAERVILGTAAYTDVDFLDDVLGAYRERVIVSVDTRGGNISTSGWQQTTQMPAESVIERLQNRGVRSFIYTNVDKDGMLQGPDPDEVRRIAAVVRGRFLYSGGIGTLDHLRALRDLRQVNLGGVIVGKALYEGNFTVPEGQQALEPARDERYVPAAGRRAFTRLYDPVVALSMRESTFRGRLCAQVLDGVAPGASVVDVGCGTGTLAIALAARGAEVVAVDGDPEVLSLARAKAGADAVQWRKGTATALGLPGSSADRVVMSLLLHHLDAEAKRAALAEAVRVLRPGGRLHVADWGRPRDPLMRAAAWVLQRVDGVEGLAEHLDGRLYGLLADAGLAAVAVHDRLRTGWGSLELLSALRPAL